MAYIINNSRGNIVAVVDDGTVNTTATDVALVGRAVVNYGEYQNENYVYLLENFADSSAPTQPILGQLWYNSATDTISAYSTTNTWAALASQNYVDAQKISPAFTGVPTAPTASVGTATTQLATTAFVTNGPEFAGLPTAPTASVGTNTTQLATTAFVQNQVNALGTMSIQNSNSVTITGGTITGITDVAVADGGTGASTAADARTNLAVPPNTRTVTGAGGLTGGGDLSADRTITIASNSNGYGIRYVSTVAPNIAGVSGDVWYQII